jgi:integrase/recombinase XerD
MMSFRFYTVLTTATDHTPNVSYIHISVFFNFFRNNIDSAMGNPCDTPMIRKLYRERVVSKWEIIEKETIDEIIFRTKIIRNRLILELMGAPDLLF